MKLLADNLPGDPAPLSKQVSEGRYFFLNLSPALSDKLTVVYGGSERCNPDYEVHRRSFRYYCCEYVAEGRGQVTLDGKTTQLRPGSVFFYGLHTRCEIRNDPEHPMTKYFVCVAGQKLPRHLKSIGLRLAMVQHLSAHWEVRSTFDDMIRQGQRHTQHTMAICESLLNVLFFIIADVANQRTAKSTRAQETFLRCRSEIEAQSLTLKTLAEIARAVGVDSTSLCRLFRRYQGTSPYQYLLRQKMNHAAKILVTNPEVLVKDVALRVGYSDPYHFSRLFKSIHGVSPGHFINQ
ncbi:MAG TPA: AraC family transcriptional regulator [Opitutaceae bacterium]|nr:AraC family transcriptional regulator [Opitutaceae bacterium]